MKLNWGHKITIAMVLFMGFILYMVVSLSLTKVDLYSEDYYQKELDYEQHISAVKNSEGIENKIIISAHEDAIAVTFDPSIAKNIETGSIYFYKPDNSEADKGFELKLSSNRMIIPSRNFAKGTYTVKITWSKEGKDFYVEKQIFVE